MDPSYEGVSVSVIADSVIQSNSGQRAPFAVASEVFSLAEDGYLTLRPAEDSITITRTDKPIGPHIDIEQQLILAALLPKITLGTPHQVPIAQTILAVTCRRLKQQRFGHKVSPRRLMRYMGISLWTFIAVTGVVASAIHISALCPAIALFALCVLGWKTNSGVNTIKAMAMFPTKAGRAEQRRLEALHQNLDAKKEASQPSLLAYELLWTTHMPLVHAPDKVPQWFIGEWPADAEERSILLRGMLGTIATGLTQKPNKKGRFTLDQEAFKEIELYQFIGTMKDSGEIFYGLATDTPIDLGPDS